MRRRTRRNPSVTDLATIALVGGVGLVVLSNLDKLGIRLPGLPSPPPIDPPGGGAGGHDPTPPPPSDTPERPVEIRIGEPSWERFVGSDRRVTFTVRFRHQGRAAQLVVGAGIALVNWRCSAMVFQDRNQPFQYVEADMEVGDNPGWQNYEQTVSAFLQDPTASLGDLYDVVVYVRDTYGNVLDGYWHCRALQGSPF